MNFDKKRLLSMDFLITLLIAAVSVYFFLASSHFSPQGKLFPQIVAALTFFACAVQAITILKAPTSAADPKAEEEVAAPPAYRHFVMMGIAVLYLLLFKPVGFLLCTIILLAAIPYYLGSRKHLIIWVLSIGLTLFFYFVFKNVFFVPLPQGIIKFM